MATNRRDLRYPEQGLPHDFIYEWHRHPEVEPPPGLRLFVRCDAMVRVSKGVFKHCNNRGIYHIGSRHSKTVCSAHNQEMIMLANAPQDNDLA